MRRRRRIFGFLRSERGQVLPLVVISAVVLIGFTGLAIDLGRVWIAKQQLQRAVDASTLAAGQDLPDTSTAVSAAQTYAANGTRNPLSGWGVSAGAPSITFECNASGPDYTSGSSPTCLTDTSGDNCHPSGSSATLPSGATTCNEVYVKESARVKTGLLSLFIPSFTVTATSTAAARGTQGLPKPMNIFVVLDTTGSMTSSCSASVTGISSTPDKLDCAKAGVRALLQALPTTSGSVDDDVGIAVFPALSTTLTGTTTTGSLTGSVTQQSTSMTVTTSAHAYVGATITGPGIPSGTTIAAASQGSPYNLTLSNKATSTKTTQSYTASLVSAPYSLPTAPPMTPPDAETNCSSSSSFGVTYPPYAPYTYTSNGTGGIPSADLGNYTNYTSPGYIDDYAGYEAVPLSSDYLTNGSLNSSSNLVQSVYWSQCSGGNYPGGDYYGIKDIGGQGSYLAGAITAAQSLLAAQPQTRTVGGTSYPVTNAIIVLSDGEMNDPKSGSDGVDPGANGNVSFASTTPCEDALSAATAAKAAGTLVFSIAYDDVGGTCDDSGTGTGPSACTSTSTSEYSGSGPYSGSACGLMADLATSSAYFADQSAAGDLTQDFTAAASQLNTGYSVLTPDCPAGKAPPNC